MGVPDPLPVVVLTMHFDTSTLTLPEALAIAQADARACVADAAAQSGLASPDVVAGETISVDADRLTAAVANDVPFGAAAVAVASGRRADRASDRASDRGDRAHLASSSHAASSPASARRLLASYEFLYSESTPEMALRCVVRAREMDPVSALRVGLHALELVAGAPAITDPALARPGAGAADAAAALPAHAPTCAAKNVWNRAACVARGWRRYLGALAAEAFFGRCLGFEDRGAATRVGAPGGEIVPTTLRSQWGYHARRNRAFEEPARVNLYASALELRTNTNDPGEEEGDAPASAGGGGFAAGAERRGGARANANRGGGAYKEFLGACETWRKRLDLRAVNRLAPCWS